MTRARAEEYRRRAQECLDAARLISIETSRAALLDMAQSWLRLAEEQEGREEIIRSRVSEQPQAPNSNSNNRSNPRTTTRGIRPPQLAASLGIEQTSSRASDAPRVR
jgi:hypothetical protein